MTMIFTEEEKKYIRYKDTGDYRMYCSDDAPEEIKASITQKIKAHKKWLMGEQEEGKNEGRSDK